MQTISDFQQCACSGKNLPRMLQPAIMAILMLDNEPLHGYRLLELLRDEALFKAQPPDQAGVYRILKNMEQDGLVASSWDIQDNGARKQYTLTDRGRRCTRSWKRALCDYQQAVDAVIALLQRALSSSEEKNG